MSFRLRFTCILFWVLPAFVIHTTTFTVQLRGGEGFGPEVKRRILMGSFALSAGYSDAYYKRAQEVQRIVEAELAAKLAIYDALLTPASPTPAYRANAKVNDPLAMFSGDKMTVNVNLAGLPAIVVRRSSGFRGGKDTACRSADYWPTV